MPLIPTDLIEQLLKKHTETQATITFVTAHNSDPSLQVYGRVIEEGTRLRIVEAKEFTGDTQTHCCINAGIYLIHKNFLTSALSELSKNTASGEFFITDLIGMATMRELTVAMVSASFDDIRGINTYKELWATEQIKKSALMQHWMNNGVRFAMPQSNALDLNVTIGRSTFIAAGAHIRGNSHIGENCFIGEFSIIENSTIEHKSSVLSHCVLNDAHVQSGAQVGPFAHLRNHTIVGINAHIGNFVELKNSVMGAESKAKHLSYLGDATVGSQVNIGAGTITCNHNGVEKHRTIIEDHAYVGSNNTLVAPVTLGANCFTAAGSVITEHVPANALGIGRARQVNKEEYALRLKKKKADVPIKNTYHAALTKNETSSMPQES